ncbi:hypothetical protein M885DRAFT_615313 [Pelagophyceae sp. CCMP2097]|nr:hypothetical protein M885DRAFT_615313 [Pelagophyceae sp. CCMP2097]
MGFDGDHWAGDAAYSDMRAAARAEAFGGVAPAFAAPPREGPHAGGLRRCSACGLLKLRREFNREQAALPALQRVCDDCGAPIPADVGLLKVDALRFQLEQRGLPATGLKGELVSRLEAACDSSRPGGLAFAGGAFKARGRFPAVPASKLKKAELRSELEKRGLVSVGLKAALVQRLQNYVYRDACAPAQRGPNPVPRDRAIAPRAPAVTPRPPLPLGNSPYAGYRGGARAAPQGALHEVLTAADHLEGLHWGAAGAHAYAAPAAVAFAVPPAYAPPDYAPHYGLDYSPPPAAYVAAFAPDYGASAAFAASAGYATSPDYAGQADYAPPPCYAPGYAAQSAYAPPPDYEAYAAAPDYARQYPAVQDYGDAYAPAQKRPDYGDAYALAQKRSDYGDYAPAQKTRRFHPLDEDEDGGGANHAGTYDGGADYKYPAAAYAASYGGADYAGTYSGGAGKFGPYG